MSLHTYPNSHVPGIPEGHLKVFLGYQDIQGISYQNSLDMMAIRVFQEDFGHPMGSSVLNWGVLRGCPQVSCASDRP